MGGASLEFADEVFEGICAADAEEGDIVFASAGGGEDDIADAEETGEPAAFDVDGTDVVVAEFAAAAGDEAGDDLDAAGGDEVAVAEAVEGAPEENDEGGDEAEGGGFGAPVAKVEAAAGEDEGEEAGAPVG